MSKAKSAEEAQIPMDREEQASGSPDTAPYPVSSTLPEGMPMPSAPGEQQMGGVKKGGMGHMGNDSMSAAVNQLNYETERNEHSPTVAGEDMSRHHGIMKKA